MFIKEAVLNAGRKLFTDKQVSRLENSMIMQFLFLTTVPLISLSSKTISMNGLQVKRYSLFLIPLGIGQINADIF